MHARVNRRRGAFRGRHVSFRPGLRTLCRCMALVLAAALAGLGTLVGALTAAGPASAQTRVAAERAPGAEVQGEEGRPLTRAERRARLLTDIDEQLGIAEVGIDEARFGESREAAATARRWLTEMRWENDLTKRWVRLDRIEVTLLVAYGDMEAAHEAAVRAIGRDPGMRLDPRRTSPKLLKVYEAARAERGR